ncbi:MAG TPA: 1-deoxy-D-xylulose-5-phosphate synthase [Candidatus Omnitrophota bacterium]|nr:1-deoxy-D-xylulose-5-phosphate synthase [Candidatus Omnitrophota bacterium]
MTAESESLLAKIQNVSDLKKLRPEQLPVLAAELRRFMIETVSKTGGHLGAGLGAVELTIALHYVLDTPRDKVIWDISHQTYPHKILTGRKDRMRTLRQYGGLSGFTNPAESEHDHFLVAHAGTAISQALGLACARDFLGGKEKIVAVIGDGGLSSGLALEGLNNAGHLRKKMLIVLNDNEMSISKNVGGISRYLNKVITNPLYNRLRADVEKSIEAFPRLKKLARYALEGVKHLLVPGIVFEELGLRYFGPVNGHDVIGLVKTLENVSKIEAPILLHVLTEKGKGYEFAEKDEERFHGVNPFDVKTGEKLIGTGNGSLSVPKRPTYTEAFGRSLAEIARENPKVFAITAAMPSGTGLLDFQKEFPNRFYDVGIAEQHAVTFSAALAKAGLKPVCAIYSTFLQRSEDQLIHDIALQKVGVTLGLDRAGLVGADGATHNGVFDISYIGHIPDAVIASPRDAFEMKRMLTLGIEYQGLFAIRYPKDEIPEFPEAERRVFNIGEGEILREGEDAVLLAFGSLARQALDAAQLLSREGVKAAVCNMRFAKPLDRNLLLSLVSKNRLFYTIEDHVLTGGFGSKVLEFFEREGLAEVRVKRIALPDEFTEHGPRGFLLDRFGLSAAKIAEYILDDVKKNEKSSHFGLFPWKRLA